MTAENPGNLVFVGDVHLESGDAALEDFLSFLDRVGRTAARIVLMGDLFNLWVARAELERPHQVRVIDRLVELRARGIVVRYIEGNRDYRVGRRHSGGALDDSTDNSLVEEFGGHRVFAAHGDLVNVADRQYRLWRRLSRSQLFWAAFRMVPRARRVRMAEALEARMRSTNLAFKQEFPEQAVRGYAAELFAAGHDIVVLGHFHTERDLTLENDGPRGRILVLPEWRESRRHLEVGLDGRVGFVDSPY